MQLKNCLLLFYILVIALEIACTAQPIEVRVGDPAISYINLKISPDMKYATWVENLTGLQQNPAWLCAIDRETGSLIPDDGKGFFIGRIKNAGALVGSPQWGQDSAGFFSIAIDEKNNLLMLRPESAFKATITMLPTAPNKERIFPCPACLPNRDFSYIAYLQKDENKKLQAWYIDLAEPTVEHQVTSGDPGFYPPMNAEPLAVDRCRWFPGEPIFIFGYLNEFEKLQINQYDVSRHDLAPVPITNDKLNHIDEMPTTITGERYLIGGINNEAFGKVYKRPAGSEFYKPIQTITPVATDLITPTSALAFEPFMWEGKSFTSFQIQEPSSKPLLSTAPGEIWLTSILEDSVLRRLHGPEPMVRANPEFYIGTSKVWVFYQAKAVGDDNWRLYRAETGLSAASGKKID